MLDSEIENSHSDQQQSRIGVKDLIAIMIAQLMILLPIVVIFMAIIALVLWLIMRAWA
jgi:hypothetical protein